MTVANRKSIEDRIYGAAEARAKGHGVQFGTGAASDIRHLAKIGADRVIVERPKDPDDATEEAVTAIEKFVDEMVAARFDVYDAARLQQNIIGEQTFIRARDLLCPVWPFC